MILSNNEEKHRKSSKACDNLKEKRWVQGEALLNSEPAIS